MKIKKKKAFFFLGGGVRVGGVRVDVIEELKFCENSKIIFWGSGGGGCQFKTRNTYSKNIQ